MFGYGSSEIRKHVHKEAEHSHALVVVNALMHLALDMIVLSDSLKTEDATYYMRYGAGRRLLMMWRSYRTITSIAPPGRKEPLSDEEGTALSGDINVIYMHLRGVMDNLAWCFLYEKEPYLAQRLPKMVVALFSSVIKKRTSLPEFGNEVDADKDWAAELAERRDPVAHRIPLYVPPAAITTEEVAVYQELTGEFFKSINRLDFEASDAASEEMLRVGQFLPCFVHHPGAGIVPMYPTVSLDMVHAIDLGRILVQYIK